MIYLGIDTSNYTTSVAAYDSESKRVIQYKKLLPVKKGEKGLRQSDAVFHHTRQFPALIKELTENVDGDFSAVGVSVKPRMIDGSYMPCFTVGSTNAVSISSVMRIPMYEFSHQQGHIMAALYSAGKTELINEPFIAFHVSGGTTEALYVKPDENDIISCEIIAASSDLKAGQAIDRVGVMMGLDFPCGMMLDKLAAKSDKEYKIRITLKDGDCSLSGLENKCRAMYENGESNEDIAKFCIDYISAALEKMTLFLLEKYGNLPLVFSGGVMSNSIISKRFKEKFGAYFATSEFSSDNAAGTAILASVKGERNEHSFDRKSD